MPLSPITLSPITCRDFIDAFTLGMDDMVKMSLPEARLRYEQLCQQLGAPLPAGITTHDETLTIEGRTSPLRLRHFCPVKGQDTSRAPVIYIHGGGWQIGSIMSHQGVAASLAHQLGRDVISIDYRLLPEASYHDALEDCLAAIRFVSQTNAPVALVGDSAGARLVMDVARAMSGSRSTSDSSHVLGLIYPPLDPIIEIKPDNHDDLGPSAPLLSREEIVDMWQIVAEGDDSDSYAPSPAHSQLAPARQIEVLSVEYDPLTTPLEAAVATWREQGVDVGYRCAPGMVHAALHAHHELPEMGIAWRDFCDSLTRRLDEA